MAHNSQKYEKFESKKFESYDEANTFASLKFNELTGTKANKDFNSSDYRVRIRRRNDQNHSVFDVVSMRRIGLNVKSADHDNIVATKDNVRKGGKRDRKRQRELTKHNA